MTKKESMYKLKMTFRDAVSANTIKSIKSTYSKIKSLDIGEEDHIPVSLEKEVNELT